jgi:hypothetical protein
MDFSSIQMRTQRDPDLLLSISYTALYVPCSFAPLHDTNTHRTPFVGVTISAKTPSRLYKQESHDRYSSMRSMKYIICIVSSF